MIFKMKWEDGRIDWCTAQNQLHLLKSYDKDYDLELQLLEEIEEISDEEAKTIMLDNSEYEENNNEPKQISLYDIAGSDTDFMIIGSTEF